MRRRPDVEAAGVIPVHPSGAVLLALRDDRPDVGSPNRWGMLGGQLEPGEAPEQAALRELEEEAGRRPAALIPLGYDDHPSLRFPGRTVRSHLFTATVAWSLDDLVIGEGQLLDWFMPHEVPALPLVLPLAHLITGFLGSETYARLTGDRTVPRPALTGSLPPELPAALGLRAGHLLAVHGITAGYVRRLWDLLDGVRVTASPAAHERPDVVLWRQRLGDAADCWTAWQDRLAPGGKLWLLDRREVFHRQGAKERQGHQEIFVSSWCPWRSLAPWR